MKFSQFTAILQKKKNYQKIPQKLLPGNYFQAILCLQIIKHNLYWKMKLLRQATYIRYVLTKLSNLSKSAHRSPQIPFYRGFLEN